MDDRQRVPGDGGLKFFGTITASVTHELNNVISIIDQVSGLLKDMTAGAEAGFTLQPEQLKKIHERISHQAQRGVEIIKSLNSFAHSVDEPVRDVELKSLVGNLFSLSRRFAELQRVVLTVQLPEDEIRTRTDPYALQYILFHSFRRMLAHAERDDRILIGLAAEETAVISISGPAGSGGSEEEISRETVKELAERLSLRLSSSIKDQTEKVDIRLPVLPL